MENLEKKKGNGFLIVIIIILLIAVIGLVLYVLNDKGIVKIIKTKKNTTEIKNDNKKEVTKKETTTIDKKTNESKIIYSGNVLDESKDFGRITFGGKEVAVKFDYGDGATKKLYVGEKSIEIINGSVNNIAIMGDYLVIGIDQDGYRFELYNQALEKADSVGNALGLVTGTKSDTSKWLIDENNLIYYECNADYNSSNNDTLNTYNLKITDSKMEKVLLSSTQGVSCTSQR